eukprot:Rhum_TRINITY_DN21223_c0_g1::Rhum_TRINITY_DN21223_c0_g1_i1::g.173422::m.173422
MRRLLRLTASQRLAAPAVAATPHAVSAVGVRCCVSAAPVSPGDDAPIDGASASAPPRKKGKKRRAVSLKRTPAPAAQAQQQWQPQEPAAEPVVSDEERAAQAKQAAIDAMFEPSLEEQAEARKLEAAAVAAERRRLVLEREKRRAEQRQRMEEQARAAAPPEKTVEPLAQWERSPLEAHTAVRDAVAADPAAARVAAQMRKLKSVKRKKARKGKTAAAATSQSADGGNDVGGAAETSEGAGQQLAAAEEPAAEEAVKQRKRKHAVRRLVGATSELPQYSGAGRSLADQAERAEQRPGAALPQTTTAEPVVAVTPTKKITDDSAATRVKKAAPVRAVVAGIEAGVEEELRTKGITPQETVATPLDYEAADRDAADEADAAAFRSKAGRNIPKAPGTDMKGTMFEKDGNLCSHRYFTSDQERVIVTTKADASEGVNDGKLEPFLSWDDVYMNVKGAVQKKCQLVKHVKTSGFEHLTTVQRYSLPLLLSGCNAAIRSQTGTGKTLAYLMQAIPHTTRKNLPNRQREAAVLIILPNPELAHQVQTEAYSIFGRECAIKRLVRQAARDVKDAGKKADIIIADIYALKTYCRAPKELRFSFANVSNIIVDESSYIMWQNYYVMKELFETIVADKEELPPKHMPKVQVTCWGATQATTLAQRSETQGETSLFQLFSRIDEERAVEHQKPLQLSSPDVAFMQVGESALNPDISHHINVCSPIEQRHQLAQLYETKQLTAQDRVIVYLGGGRGTSDTIKVVEVIEEISKKGEALTVSALCARDMHAADIKKKLRDFRRSETNVLVCAGTTLRGLDLPNVTKVVVLGLPPIPDDWVHVVGRCSRAGSAGVAYTYAGSRDAVHLPFILDAVKEAHPEHPAFDGRSTSAINSSSGYVSVEDDGISGERKAKVVLGPGVLDVYQRMGTALDRMGAKHRFLGVTPHENETGSVTFSSDAYDPKVGFLPRMTNSQKAYAKQTQKVVAKKRRLRGLYYRRAAQLMSNHNRTAVEHRMRRTAMRRSPLLVQSAFEEDERHKDESDKFLKRQDDLAKKRRSKQIQLWRKRTGITDTNIVPDHVYSPVTSGISYVPAEGTITTGQGAIKHSSSKAPGVSSYYSTHGSGEMV